MSRETQGQLRPEALIGGLAAGVVLTLVAGYLYVLKPSLDVYTELADERARATLELEAEEDSTRQLEIDAVTDRIDALQGQLYGGSSQVPLKQMEAYVIDSLDRISARHDVELTSVTPGDAARVLMFGELPYDVQVAGTYFHLFDWLHEVERELRPMVVKSFEMQGGESAGSVTLKLRLVAYRTEEADT